MFKLMYEVEMTQYPFYTNANAKVRKLISEICLYVKMFISKIFA